MLVCAQKQNLKNNLAINKIGSPHQLELGKANFGLILKWIKNFC
jgi:hypothetical protein